MPEILIYAVEGRSAEQKTALMQDITAAVVKNFGVDKNMVVVSIMETPKAHKARGGVLYSEFKSAGSEP